MSNITNAALQDDNRYLKNRLYCIEKLHRTLVGATAHLIEVAEWVGISHGNERIRLRDAVAMARDAIVGRLHPASRDFTFAISYPGEPGAGYQPYNETVTITVDSGNVGNEQDFTDHMTACLAQWYDGATVTKEGR